MLCIIKLINSPLRYYLLIALVIIYIIVTIGIVSGVLLVYGAGLDVRKAEAGILSNKVADCLVEKGKLVDEVWESDFNLLEFCNLDLRDNTKNYEGEEQYGVQVEILSFENKGELKKINVGREDFLEFCKLKGEKIPKCGEKETYVIGEARLLLKITSAVGKTALNT